MKKCWLMKSEPKVYSIDHLSKDHSTLWEGVRNYQARNFMAKEMKIGDDVLFYHSNAEPPGIVGVAKIKRVGLADPSQFDKKSEYYDPKSSQENPIWFCVEVEFVEKFKTPVSLDQIRAEPKLKDMMVIKKGQRLSIQPVLLPEFSWVLKLAK